MATAEVTSRERGLAWLIGTRNSDGVWGYRPGGDSYVEPTSLALAALLVARDSVAGAGDAANGAIEWLIAHQRPDGGWGVSTGDGDPSWMAAGAIWSLALARDSLSRADLDARIAAGAKTLLVERRIEMTAEDQARQRELLNADPTLVGWSWSPETASWVFPTAWSIIAALAADSRNRDSERVRQGLAFLRDRACADGGWNFGNPYMVGQAYAPNAVDTSATLLAFAAAGERDGALVDSGCGVLEKLLESTRSALGLAWASLALGAQSRSAGAERARSLLAGLQSGDGSWRRSPFATAVALLALGDLKWLSARGPG